MRPRDSSPPPRRRAPDSPHSVTRPRCSTEKTLRPGQSGTLKTNMRHWARAQGRTRISITGNGPFLITYVNAADDPRTAKPKAK